MTVEKLIFAACRGGWPASLDVTSQEAQLLIAQDYVNVICDEDISRVDGVRRQPALARLIMRSYARNIRTLVKKSKMLADIVLHLADGRYALIECKLGSQEIEDGAKHLLQLRDLIREKNKTEHQMPLREPDLLIVMTGGEMAYTREDGVKVIPLATLKD